MATSGAGTPDPGQGVTNDQGTAPEGTTVDWEARAHAAEQNYNELRPRWTQDSQALSEYERLFEALQDPETQSEALEALGFELDQGVPQGGTEDVSLEDWEDPLEREIQELRGTVDELHSQREQEQDMQEEEELIDLRDEYIGSALDYIESETNREFSERAEMRIGNLAIAMAGDDGVPDVQGAYNELYGKDGLVEEEWSSRVQTRTGAYQAPGGRTAPASKDTSKMTGRERAQYFDERLRALEE